MIDSLEDKELQGLLVLFEGHLNHLRSIKEVEIAWLDRFSIITLPSIGYFLTRTSNTLPVDADLWLVAIVYLFVTMWMQNSLRQERLSYYRVLRSVIRIQNLLGLFKIGILTERMVDAPFPKGLGPHPKNDGTQPFASFMRRQVYTWIIYTSLIVVIVYKNILLWPLIGLIIIDAVFLVFVYIRDQNDLKNEAIKDKNLAGSDPMWYKNVDSNSNNTH
jgi:hypothetical protein